MKIGLALSGGGAMGAAHVGVLQQLEKRKIKISSICGTSAGAIVGLLYADGGNRSLITFLDELETAGLLSRTKLILKKNETIFKTIEQILNKIVKAKDFSDLSIAYSCVATDVITGEMVILDHGDSVSAVMASAAYPGVFPIQKIEGRYLVDGGLTMNLPVSVLREQGCDFVIASSLYSLNSLKHAKNEDDFRMNQLSVAIRSIDILTTTLAGYELKNCDFCFTPPLSEHSWYDFAQTKEILKLGQDYASEKVTELEKAIAQKPKGIFERLLGA